MSDRHRRADDPPTQPPRLALDPAPAAQARLIGERVRAARVAAQQTQLDLAGTRYSKSYISAVEHGKMIPSLQALALLAARLGVPISQLLGVAPPTPAVEPTEPTLEEGEQSARLYEAEQLVQEGRYEEAIARFEQLGQRDRTIWAYEQYALFLAAEGRYQDAYEQMRHAIRQSQ